RGPDPEASWLVSRAALQEGDLPAASAALEQSPDYATDSVFAREPAPFVGAAKCAECHKAIHKVQQQSLHARTFYPTTGLGGIALPDRPVVDPLAPGVVHAIRREGGKIHVETRVDEKVYRAL